MANRIDSARQYIIDTLLRDANEIVLPITLEVEYLNKQNEKCKVAVVAIKRNSRASRPRLFGVDDKPVELSYCYEKSLTDAIRTLKEYYANRQEKMMKEKSLNYLKPVLGTDFRALLQPYNVDLQSIAESKTLLVESLKTMTEESLEELKVYDLDSLSDKVRAIYRWIDLLIIYSTIEDYDKLSAHDKSLYHQVQAIKKHDVEDADFNHTIHWALSNAWRYAEKYNETKPILEGGYTEKEFNGILQWLKSHNYTSFLYKGESSALMGIIHRANMLHYSELTPITLSSYEPYEGNRIELGLQFSYKE